MRRKNENSNSAYFIILIIIVIFVFYLYNQNWFGLFSSEPKKELMQTETEQKEILKEYKSKTAKISENINGALIDVEYPYFENVVDKNIKFLIDEKISDFKESLPIGSDVDNSEQFLNISYDENKYSRNIYSISFNMVYSGGIHPIEDVECMNYDLDKGKRIELADVFKADSDYLKKLSSSVSAELLKIDGADTEWIKDGCGPVEKNFSKFILKDNNIVFYFSPGAVFSNSFGVIKAAIPLSSLKGFLSDDFIS